MQQPLDRGSPINTPRIEHWLAHFSNYHSPVTRNAVELWIGQFAIQDHDLAARILDSVLFINPVAIQHSFSQLLNGIPGWNIDPEKRQGQWYFVPFSGSTGESGDSMLHLFRMANGLTHRRFNNLFIHRSEIPTKNLTENDTVILVDDFSGTGTQACTSWEKIFKELFIGDPRIILFLLVATDRAIARITEETEMAVYCHRILHDRDNIFHADCIYFNDAEKGRVFHYCTRADNVNPRGFGDTGLLLVFSHRCPNNSIPILHNNRRHNWSALFPRFLGH